MLSPGDKAPDFELPDQDGNLVKLSDLKGKTVVLYFYPKADTPGCTTQACGVRDHRKDYESAGAVVLGISPDPVKRVKKFHDGQGLNFTLLADEDGAVAKKFGVPTRQGSGKVKGKDASNKPIDVQHPGVLTDRWTFVIGKDGKIIYKKEKVNPAEDSKAIMDLVNKQS